MSQPPRRRAWRSFRQFATLAGFTTLDLIRQPISLLLTAACVVLMGFAAMQAFQFGENGKFARDSCLSLQFIFGLAAGAYGACTTLNSEIRNGTALVVLSKPVSREVFFTAKFAGLAVFVILFSACAIPASLLCEKASPELYVTDSSALLLLLCAVPVALALAALANYRFGRPFTSTAFWLIMACLIAGLGLASVFHGRIEWDPCGHTLGQQEACTLHWRLVPAGILVALALVVLTGIALAMATRLSTVPVITLSAGILFLGLLSDYLLAGAGPGPITAIWHSVVPNWQHFWMADALTHGGTIPWSYVAVAALYSACYLAVALTGGLLLFRWREMK